METDNNGFVVLGNQLAECKISLWGGHIVSYRPENSEYDVFWLGELNKFDNERAIRGGVPICWPRVAEEKLNGELPRHGFARISEWKLEKAVVHEDKMEAEFFLLPDAKFDVKASARLSVRVSDGLECCLETVNNGNEVFNFSEALHAYFNVSSVDDIKIKGLEGHRYKNSLDGKVYTLEGDLKICGEVDAIFTDHSGNVEIEDRGFNRVISIEKTGSKTTVIWNPNKDYPEMTAGQYRNFVCVEPSNQADSFVSIMPNEKHKISMKVKVRKLEG